MRKINLKMVNEFRDAARRGDVQALIDQGMNSHDIARRYSVSPSTVSREPSLIWRGKQQHLDVTETKRFALGGKW